MKQIGQWEGCGNEDHGNIYLVVVGKDSINGLHLFQTTRAKFDTCDSLGPVLEFEGSKFGI
jgi:hypothetical protein